MRPVLLLALIACGRDRPEGLPPASDWSDTDPLAPPSRPEGVPGASALEDEAMHVLGEPPAAQPPQEIDVAPEQPGDPAHRIRGTLTIAKTVADKVEPGGVIFLMAKAPDATGKPTGTALAVDRVTWTTNGHPFELDGASGEVLAIARYDQDGDASSEQPGDVVGMIRVKVPADDVVIELSTLVK